MHGEIAADIPVGPLVSEAPLYERPWVRARAASPRSTPPACPKRDPLDCLKRLLACPDLASKRWIWEQYDHLVQGNTVKRPGGDAAVIRIGDSRQGAGAQAPTRRRAIAAPTPFAAARRRWRKAGAT